MSCALPNVEIVLRNVSLPVSWRRRSGSTISLASVSAARESSTTPGYAFTSLVNALELGVGGDRGPPAQTAAHVRAPLREIEDAGRHAFGVHRDPQSVRGRFEQNRCDPLGENR